MRVEETSVIPKYVHNALILVKSKRTHLPVHFARMEYDDRPEPAKRLEIARLARGFKSVRAAAEYFGWNYYSYAQHENGLRGLAKSAKRYATAYGVSEGWLLTGEGTGPGSSVTTPIIGRAGAGPNGEVIFDAEQQVLEEVPAPPGATPATVGLNVQGDSMRGIANDGWLIFYEDRHFPPTDDMLGELCVVGTGGGQTLVKFLAPGRGPGLYDLESINAPVMRDEPVQWAALVTSIVPRKPARRMMKADPLIGKQTAKLS